MAVEVVVVAVAGAVVHSLLEEVAAEVEEAVVWRKVV